MCFLLRGFNLLLYYIFLASVVRVGFACVLYSLKGCDKCTFEPCTLFVPVPCCVVLLSFDWSYEAGVV